MRLLTTLVASILVVSSGPAAAQSVRVLASEANGVTLQLSLPPFSIVAQEGGRSELRVQDLTAAFDVPGRPGLPYATALIAVPPGAKARAHVVSGAAPETQDVRLSITAKPVFRQGTGGSFVPDREPVAALQDGVWPTSSVEVGEPFTLRRQRLVAVRIMPFRYDESAGRLTVQRSMVVRVDFLGGTPAAAGGPVAADGSWESVLRAGVLNYEQAKGWRAAPMKAVRRSLFAAPGRAAPAGSMASAAFDEDNPEVRVKVDSTGVYELGYASLSTNGYPAGVPISQVSVHRHEFVEGATPSYVTIELPIEVDDRNNDGVFNGTDRIVVFVQSWASRSRASWAQRAWGDAEVVYVTSVNGSGLRIPTRPGWRGTPGLTPLVSYPTTSHWEKNLSYFTFPIDTLNDQFHWTEIALYYYRDDSIHFETNHLDTTHAVTVSALWRGRADTAHYTWAQYRNGGPDFFTIADSLLWSSRGGQMASVTLPGSTLGEGNVNTFRFWGKRYGFQPGVGTNDIDNIGLDWIEATYWRRFRAIRSYLPANSGDATGEIQIQSPGYANNDVRVYDVTDSLQPQRLVVDASHVQKVGNEYTIEFQDSVGTGAPHRYVVFAVPKTVPAANFSAVTRRQLTAVNGDYLLVVPEAFLPAVGPLVTLRQAEGHHVVVAPFESVCDEFNGGRRSSYSIKRFVRYAYDNWNARFLLLLGDGSEDPMNFLGEATRDWIPAQKINGPVGIPFGYEIDVSDPWYVCMGNCDLVATPPAPVLQDLFLGRLPANSLQEAQGMVAKVVAYDNITVDQTWRSKILLSSDDQYSGATFFGGGGSGQTDYCRRPNELVFKNINQTIAGIIKNDAGLQAAQVDTFSLGDILGDIACVNPIPTDTCQCRDLASTRSITHGNVTPLLRNHLNDGRMWWNFQGHANQLVLTHEDLWVDQLSEDDKDDLMNDGKPFLFSAFSCHANAFAGQRQATFGPALGEDMVDMPSRGAIASWASSGYEILPSGSNSHINISWARRMFQNPPHDEFLNQKGARVLLGESIALALADYVPGVQFNANEKGLALSYQLLGDPATQLSIGEPEAAVLANQLPVTDGQPVRLHTQGDTLRLEATLASNVELTQISLQRQDPTGPPVTIPPNAYSLTPAFPDTAASGSGGRRYQLSYAANLLPDSYHYIFHTTDRYGVPGSFDVYFQFLTQLRVDQTVLRDGDIVPAAANLSVKLLSPKPLVPSSDLALFVNGVSQPFTAAPVPGDASGREWVLSWTHTPYPADAYTVRLDVQGASSHFHTFLVGEGGVKVNDLVAFPNPFDDAGTAFSFTLVADSPTDIQIRVFTTAGRLIYERIERGLLGGYHQLPWNGVDAEGSSIANGVYLYKLIAANGEGKAEELGRLVRLRKPRHASTGS